MKLLERESLQLIGNLRTRHSRDIASSRIGVGFECLEREMWEDTPQLYRLAGETGAKHARVQTGWFRCERERGTYHFDWLEEIVDKLLAQGIHPWFNLSYGNPLYCSGAESPDCAGFPPLFSHAARSAWSAFVAALVTHFSGKVTHYEIWNEPDCSGFWRHGPNAAEYMDLVTLTSPVIRQTDPKAKVIGGALGRSIAHLSAFEIACQYAQLGIAAYIDAFSFHRYHIMPELSRPEDYRLLRRLFNDHGGAHVELWQGESGCPSRAATIEALSDTPVTEDIQAKVALRSIVTDLAAGIDYTCYFSFSDFRFYHRNGLRRNPTYFGLLTTDDPPRPKPAYHAFRHLCTLFDDATTPCETAKLGIELDPFPPDERFTFQERQIRLKTALFQRHGRPFVAFWEPAALIPDAPGNPPHEPKEVFLQLWTYGQQIDRPVVIDPMTGNIFEPAKIVKTSPRILECGPVPVKDYPMLLADAGSVEYT